MGCSLLLFFFFNDTATTEIYTLSLHDALPIFTADGASADGYLTAWPCGQAMPPTSTVNYVAGAPAAAGALLGLGADRKSTRLNSSHANISYAVFCLKKKKPHLTYTIAPIYTRT